MVGMIFSSQFLLLIIEDKTQEKLMTQWHDTVMNRPDRHTPKTAR